MSAASAEEMRKHLKVYYMVFGALAVLTIITVGVAEMHFLTVPQAIAVAMLVAIVKGTLVACYFMHLISERGMVFWILGICGLFFFVLLFIPVVTVTESVGLH